MIPDARRFSLGAVLSVTTGRLLAPIEEVHELLDFMTGDRLMTHQLPRACRECGPTLLERHPRLRDVVVPEEFAGRDEVEQWVAAQALQLGARMLIGTLDPDDHEAIDPLVELQAMAPHMQIIAISTEADPALKSSTEEENADVR